VKPSGSQIRLEPFAGDAGTAVALVVDEGGAVGVAGDAAAAGAVAVDDWVAAAATGAAVAVSGVWVAGFLTVSSIIAGGGVAAWVGTGAGRTWMGISEVVVRRGFIPGGTVLLEAGTAAGCPAGGAAATGLAASPAGGVGPLGAMAPGAAVPAGGAVAAGGAVPAAGAAEASVSGGASGGGETGKTIGGMAGGTMGPACAGGEGSEDSGGSMTASAMISSPSAGELTFRVSSPCSLRSKTRAAPLVSSAGGWDGACGGGVAGGASCTGGSMGSARSP
jgi:hypothetical protein